MLPIKATAPSRLRVRVFILLIAPNVPAQAQPLEPGLVCKDGVRVSQKRSTTRRGGCCLKRLVDHLYLALFLLAFNALTMQYTIKETTALSSTHPRN